MRVQTRFGDFREVGGMKLPFREVAKFATPLMGQVVTTIGKAEIGVQMDDDAFKP